MKIVETHDIEVIKSLHEKIFSESFPESEFENKNSSKILINFVFYIEGIPVGYTVVFDKKESATYHLWIGGILPEFQNKGYYAEFLDIFQKMAKEKQYKEISISSYNHRPNMMRLLIKKRYQIVGTSEGKYGDNLKILFKYRIKNKQEIRIALTNVCNFKCFFCHEEGVDSSKSLFLENEKLKKILEQSYMMGYKEITLTGGEPLLNMEGIVTTIEYFNEMEEYPNLKIITNGSLIDDNFIEILKRYKGNISLNLSVHSFEKEEFDKITLTLGQLEKIEEKIELLKKNKIKFRINCVYQKSKISNRSEDEKMKKIIKKCFEKGIEEITFLEMLVAKTDLELGEKYISLENISKILNEALKGEKLRLLKKSTKKESYFLEKDDKELKINLFRLTCKRGCENCLDSKDQMIGADGNYYPCLFYSEVKCGDTSINMRLAFENGERLIRKNTDQFKGKQMFY